MRIFYSGALGGYHYPELIANLPIMLNFWEVSGRAHPISSGRAQQRMKDRKKKVKRGSKS